MSDNEAVAAVTDTSSEQVQDTNEAQQVNEPVDNVEDQVSDEQQKRTVPLEALESERRKRQDAENQSNWYKQQMTQYQQTQQAQKQEPVKDDDDEYTREMKQYVNASIQTQTRSAMERSYLESNPDTVNRIQTDLAPLLQRKPWLEESIKSAENRYSRAIEILNDYAPQVSNNNGKRIVQNASKPVSPHVSAKSKTLGRLEMIAGMSRKEFSHWRAEQRGRVPNIQ